MSTILFLCPHSAAKSVIAAAYFNNLIQESDIAWNADYAGTEPDEHVLPAVAAMLQNEGIDVSNYQPRLVTQEDFVRAQLVVSMGCSLDDLNIATDRLEKWEDIPSPSADLNGAQMAIRKHVTTLISQLQIQD